METRPSESENPFAPPAEQSSYQPQPVHAHAPSEFAVWRDGKKLVILKDSQFPPNCVKTGDPAEVWLKRTFSWANPVWYITVVFGVLPALLIVALIAKRATFQVPLSQEFNDRRKKGALVGWCFLGMSVVALGVSVAASSSKSDPTMFGLLLLLFFILFVVGIVFLARANTMIAPARISRDFVWFRGVNPKLLEPLREWVPGHEKEYAANQRVR